MFFSSLLQREVLLLGHRVSFAALGIALLFLLLGVLLSVVTSSERFRRFLGRLGLHERLIGPLSAASSLVVLLVFVTTAMRTLGFAFSMDSGLPGIGLSASQILRLLLMMFAVLWLASKAKKYFLENILAKSGLDQSLQFTLAQVAGYLIIGFGLFIALQQTGLNLSSLAVFAGALGVGLGLGLQNLASNFISGLIILTERPIKLGDRVEVDGMAGQIREIRARSTTVLTNDEISLIIPNSRFVESTIINWSHNTPKVRFRLPIGVAYGTDVEKLREILLEVARAHPASLKVPEPTVFFDNFGENALNFELVVWSSTMVSRPRRFRSDLNFAMEKALREARIDIPFPQRVVRIVGSDGVPNDKTP